MIRTIDENPVHCGIYCFPEIHCKEVKNQIEDLFAEKVIRRSISPWSVPVVIISKKQDLSE